MKAVPLIVLGMFLAAAAAAAEPAAKGDITISPILGSSWYDETLDLKSEISYGLRVGMAVDKRCSLLMEYVQSDPSRKTTGDAATVSSLRALGQFRPLASAVQPYLLGGFGGVLFNLDDTTDTAGGSASVGGGLEFAPSRRARLFAEYSAEFYRMRNVTYSPTGDVVSTSERSTDTIQFVSFGVSVGF